jgi:hypothetical protein
MLSMQLSTNIFHMIINRAFYFNLFATSDLHLDLVFPLTHAVCDVII